MKSGTKRWLVAAAILVIAGVLALQVYSARMGMHRYRSGDLGGALPLLKVATVLNPFSDKVQMALADIYIINGQPEHARVLVREVLGRNPENARAHNLMGVILQTQGDYKGAMDSYRKAISFEPGFAPAYFNMGYLLLKEGEIEKGKEFIEKAVKLDPKLEVNKDEVFRRMNLVPTKSPPASTLKAGDSG